jgi:hypothetical protein
MTQATAKRVEPQAEATAAFQLRAWARAVLHFCGYLELQEAVDVLQAWAAELGLLNVIGQDAVQQILADAFAVAEGEEP